MKTRTYFKLCDCCKGSGKMTNPEWNPNIIVCPACIACVVCNGTGRVTVTETETETEKNVSE